MQTFKGITCPPGWRYIVMSQGSLLKHSNLMSADLDGLLEFDQIVVGVIYGTRESLTDKYDIIRGITRRCRSCLRQTLRALPSVARAPSILLT